MAASFDLIRRPWVPVRIEGRTELVDLRSLFHQAHRFDDLAIPMPPAASGLWRILYAITARVTGLDDKGLNAVKWLTSRSSIAKHRSFDPVRVDEYFDRWSDRFDLFHPDLPWLQDPRLREQCPKSSGVNKLAFDRPAGNTQVWFGHFTDTRPESIPPAEAVLHLLAQLYYGASGRCTSRTVGTTSEANTAAGPLRQVMSYHPIGRSVFESLLAGLPVPSTRTADNTAVRDECPWERDTLPDPLGLPSRPTWPGGMLTARQRHAVLLVPDAAGDGVVDAYVTWAWRQPASPYDDPYVISQLSKEGRWYGRHADADRALWRDLDSLLSDSDGANGSNASRRPMIMTGCDNLPYRDGVRVRAYGFDQDGQARDRQWFVATTPPVLRWMREVNPGAASAVRIFRDAAERVGRQLDYALRDAWKEISGKEGPWPARAASYYWPRAEESFWELINELPAEQLAEPRKPFVNLGSEAIEYAIGNRDRMPVAKAFDHAQGRLRAALRQGVR